ncbi:protein OSB2, chloroplastic-like [Abrus precatorius]|uniref:Protein OSB2, chloroplastic-like n=1 Tax=Abrus precatorius TaxID=3816 RepID=A0A8B8LRY7_ABRPR|nr:protein OSB2, chloroplastic-like [Abrus precatorius]
MNGSMRRVLGAFHSHSTLILRLRSYSTRTPTLTRTRKSKPLPPTLRPSDIPFQPKLANAVNLIGEVHAPIQFETSSDGNTWAATVITRQDLSIAVIFEGDLAHTAASHLKQNDCIHVSGQLSTDPPHLQNPQHQTHFQVMVQTLNFVRGYPPPQDQSSFTRKYFHAKETEELLLDKSWKDLLQNPTQWWDVRSSKENSKGAAFESKLNGELLFINSSTPKWLQEKLESMAIDLKPERQQSMITGAKKDPDASPSSWTDLLNDSKQWCDYRQSKLNGLVNPKHPDFKHKDSSAALWLNQVPSWVLPKLKELEFDVPVVKSKNVKGSRDDQSWNDLIQNPAKWWDNRLDKRNAKAPDFKHKDTGEVLWLNGSPSWVLPKLPPPKPKQSVETGKRRTLVS